MLRPYDVVSEQPNIRIGRKRSLGRSDHGVPSVGCAFRGVERHVVAVVGVQQPDAAFFPDPVGTADDVVDDVRVDLVESLEILTTFAVLSKEVFDVPSCSDRNRILFAARQHRKIGSALRQWGIVAHTLPFRFATVVRIFDRPSSNCRAGMAVRSYAFRVLRWSPSKPATGIVPGTEIPEARRPSLDAKAMVFA